MIKPGLTSDPQPLGARPGAFSRSGVVWPLALSLLAHRQARDVMTSERSAGPLVVVVSLGDGRNLVVDHRNACPGTSVGDIDACAQLPGERLNDARAEAGC